MDKFPLDYFARLASLQCPMHIGDAERACSARRIERLSDVDDVRAATSRCAQHAQYSEAETVKLQSAFFCCDRALSYEDFQACRALHAPLTGAKLHECYQPCADTYEEEDDDGPGVAQYASACCCVVVVAAAVVSRLKKNGTGVVNEPVREGHQAGVGSG